MDIYFWKRRRTLQNRHAVSWQFQITNPSVQNDINKHSVIPLEVCIAPRLGKSGNMSAWTVYRSWSNNNFYEFHCVEVYCTIIINGWCNESNHPMYDVYLSIALKPWPFENDRRYSSRKDFCLRMARAIQSIEYVLLLLLQLPPSLFCEPVPLKIK